MNADAIIASARAQSIYESGLLVHWMDAASNQSMSEYHVNLMHENFAKLADAMGYDISKKTEVAA